MIDNVEKWNASFKLLFLLAHLNIVEADVKQEYLEDIYTDEFQRCDGCSITGLIYCECDDEDESD